MYSEKQQLLRRGPRLLCLGRTGSHGSHDHRMRRRKVKGQDRVNEVFRKLPCRHNHRVEANIECVRNAMMIIRLHISRKKLSPGFCTRFESVKRQGRLRACFADLSYAELVVVSRHTEPFTGSLIQLSLNRGLVNVRNTTEHNRSQYVFSLGPLLLSG